MPSTNHSFAFWYAVAQRHRSITPCRLSLPRKVEMSMPSHTPGFTSGAMESTAPSRKMRVRTQAK
eukprot:5709271-Prymnesium_polylepis.3